MTTAEDVSLDALRHETFGAITIDVFGLPASQGSKRHVGNGVMIESSKHVKPWREDVKNAALALLEEFDEWTPIAGAIGVWADFYFPRPKTHFRTGANAHLLRGAAPRRYVAKRPDIEKVERSTYDALTYAGVWRDDALIVRTRIEKRFADERAPGARIVIQEIDA